MPSNQQAPVWRQQLAAIQARRQVARRAKFQRSKVDRFRVELEDMKKQGASLRDMAEWLASYKRIKAHPSTIGKRLKKWRKQDGQHQ